MKLTKTLWAVLLALGLSFTSCSDDADDDNTTEPVVAALSNEIQVDIDGENWRGNISSVARSGGLTQLNAVKANSNISIQIFLPTDSINSFNIPTSIVTVAVTRGSNVLSNSPAGNLLLSTNDSTSIKGTFNCSVTRFAANADTLVLTNGEFNFTFQ